MRRTIVAMSLLACSVSAASAVQCYEGQATVKQDPPKGSCTDKEKGYSNSGKGPLTHDGCTAAKNQAMTKLRARLTSTCQPYVQANRSCTVIDVNSCN